MSFTYPLLKPIRFGHNENALQTIFQEWLLSPASFTYAADLSFAASAALVNVDFFVAANNYVNYVTTAAFSVAGTVSVAPSVSAEIYFPENVLYKLGSIKPGRSWETIITSSPTGPVQARGLRPSKWGTALTVMCYSPVTHLPDDAVFYTMKAFEDLIMGRARAWWVFDPRPETYQHTASLTVSGGAVTGLPIIFPFRGGSLAIFSSQPLGGAGSAAFDQLGPGGEWRLTAWGSPGVAPGTYPVVFSASLVNRAYRVRKTHDTDEWDFNWNAAYPPYEVAMRVEEAPLNG